LQLESEKLENGVVLVKLIGRLDLQGAQAIDLPLAGVTAAPTTSALVDISGVSFLASLGLRSLLSTAKAMSKRGGKMLLISPKPNVMDILEVSGVSSLIPIFDDLDAGLNAL